MDMSSMDMSSVSSSMASSIASSMTSASMASASATSASMSSMMSAMSSMSMDMASASTSMNMASSTAAAASSAATSMDMSGMDMSSSCQISMLWNWDTIDACFISESWHVTSRGMFAGTCIGVFAWILALEALRRGHREFDRYVARNSSTEVVAETSSTDKGPALVYIRKALPPYVWQQAVRSLLYTVEFGASYLLMLMAMYYNGYVLITMWISTFIAYFFLATDTVGVQQSKSCC